MHRHRSWLRPDGSLLGSDGDPPGSLVDSERVRLNHFIKFQLIWFIFRLSMKTFQVAWAADSVDCQTRRVRKNASDSTRNWERKRHFFKKFFYLLLSFWRSTIKVGLCQRPYSLWHALRSPNVSTWNRPLIKIHWNSEKVNKLAASKLIESFPISLLIC